MTELKNCPCCNDKVEIIFDIDIGFCFVRCVLCKTTSDIYSTESQALKAWNKRPESDLEKIKKVCKKYSKNGCENCPLDVAEEGCYFYAIEPSGWDLDKINNILEG